MVDSHHKILEGQCHSKNKLSSKKEHDKCRKTSPHWCQCTEWFSRYPIPKSGIWARWMPPFWKLELKASFSQKYEVTNAILWDNEKMKVQYLRNPLFDLFQILQAVIVKEFCLLSSFLALVFTLRIRNNKLWMELKIAMKFEIKRNSLCQVLTACKLSNKSKTPEIHVLYFRFFSVL